MERYEAYKDSGVEWIGEIPAEWNIKRIKYLTTDESSLFIDGDWIESKDIVFDESQIRYITTGNIGEGWYKEQGLAYITDEKFIALNCTEIFPGDLIISRLNPPIGRSCILPDLGARIVTSVDNVVLRPDTKYRKKYLMYSMCSNKYFEYTSLIARGATMQRISRSLLGDVALPIPSGVEEQTAIANFLDRKTAEIDALIAQKERLLELYEEEKTAIINHAVTKGLDPNVEIKDSGVEWLGKIPVGWEIKKLKYGVSKVGSGVTPSGGASIYQLSGIPLLRSQNIHVDGIKMDDVAYIDEELHDSMNNSKVLAGDVLLNITGASIGRCFYVEENFGEANVNQHVCIIRPNGKIKTSYLYFVLRSDLGVLQINIEQTGSGREGLNFEALKNFVIPYFSVEEQATIANFLDRKMMEINAKIAKTQRIIELQKEYRTALISEVVTGKIKVPELPTQEASA